MGSGQSNYVSNQEKYVKANRDIYAKVLNQNGKYYNRYQIEGKLRQEYANRSSNNGYILDHNWKEAKEIVNSSYGNSYGYRSSNGYGSSYGSSYGNGYGSSYGNGYGSSYCNSYDDY